MSRTDGLEIERKYVCEVTPDPAFLESLGGRPRSIEQTYLLPTAEAPVRRVRTIRDGALLSHVYTEKRLLRPGVREEHERPIDDETAGRLLDEADPASGTIRKTRWEIPHGRHVLELDIFESPAGLVLLEIELASVDEAVELPSWLGSVRDVSDEPAYFNVEIARRIGPARRGTEDPDEAGR